MDDRIRNRPDRDNDHRPGRGLCVPAPGRDPDQVNCYRRRLAAATFLLPVIRLPVPFPFKGWPGICLPAHFCTSFPAVIGQWSFFVSSMSVLFKQARGRDHLAVLVKQELHSRLEKPAADGIE